MFFPLLEISICFILSAALSASYKIEEQITVQKLFELQEATGEHFGKYLFEEKETLKHYINNNVILTYKKGTTIKELYFIVAVWGKVICVIDFKQINSIKIFFYKV